MSQQWVIISHGEEKKNKIEAELTSPGWKEILNGT